MTKPPPPARLASLDAYRGWVMFLMMAEALQFCAVASAKPESGIWRFLCHEQTHAPWKGCSLHDLIQPSFSFLVGVVLPFSIASRIAKGQSRRQMTRHALGRSLALIFLGVILRSINAGHANWTFEDTLSQIGLGYFFLFCLGFRKARDHWIALGAILLGYWSAFAFYPVPGNFDYQSVGVPADWPQLMTGFSAHWNKNSNLAWAFDKWLLNFFPRPHAFHYNGGGYATLSFIPTLGTMLLGLIAGNVLRSSRSAWRQVRWLVIAGAVCLALGFLGDVLGICPVVKRIWTPGWVLYSGGWCLMFLAAFHVVVDIFCWKRCAVPLVVIGSNSIAAYCIANTCDSMIDRLGWGTSVSPSGPYAPLVNGAFGLVLIWIGLYVLYRRRIFIRL